VTVTDSASPAQTGSASLSLTIGTGSATSLTVAPPTLPAALNGIPYSAALQVTGGKLPYTISQTAGALPAGITLSPAGVLSGTATQSGAYTFTVGVTDASSPQLSTSVNYTLTVADASVSIDTTQPIVTVSQSFFGMHTSVYDSN